MDGPAGRTPINSFAAAGMHMMTVDGKGTAPTEYDATEEALHPGRNSGLASNFSSRNSASRYIYRHKLLSFLKNYGRIFLLGTSLSATMLPSVKPFA
ncbi:MULTISPECIES: hypothetical protein [unclassified Polaromonas]|uniref:hypothetical protein n=1 Tax=unclassified Polaromonas TaxID=2638319 RepID=UPI0018CBE9A7|nr:MULTISPECIES: hypothetical protein [unclassified Polaromonas]MBG6070631.1 hypothetical protein [Polaromonas sp. CG_9.7]MBG6112629.1 hypothetical protein [Polaromonas sp. CG_9.2]MDH6184280.1 hypothetical protein [Polaromonas sp. CG_23.6]